MKLSSPLSSSQYGIYSDWVSHQGEVFYNLPYLYALDGGLDTGLPVLWAVSQLRPDMLWYIPHSVYH